MPSIIKMRNHKASEPHESTENYIHDRAAKDESEAPVYKSEYARCSRTHKPPRNADGEPRSRTVMNAWNGAYEHVDIDVLFSLSTVLTTSASFSVVVCAFPADERTRLIGDPCKTVESIMTAVRVMLVL